MGSGDEGFLSHFPLSIYHFPLYCTSKLKKMAESKTTSIFSKDNYIWMLAGIVVMAIGMFLLAGGKSEDPSKFSPEEVYSTTRITVAPILILAGLIIEIFAIFRKPKG
jgi:hypothetical protein